MAWGSSALPERRTSSITVVVFISGKSVIVVGARCTDVQANELLAVRGCCVP